MPSSEWTSNNTLYRAECINNAIALLNMIDPYSIPQLSQTVNMYEAEILHSISALTKQSILLLDKAVSIESDNYVDEVAYLNKDVNDTYFDSEYMSKINGVIINMGVVLDNLRGPVGATFGISSENLNIYEDDYTSSGVNESLKDSSINTFTYIWGKQLYKSINSIFKFVVKNNTDYIVNENTNKISYNDNMIKLLKEMRDQINALMNTREDVYKLQDIFYVVLTTWGNYCGFRADTLKSFLKKDVKDIRAEISNLF